MIHPWNQPLLRRLGADRATMPHAMLLHGPAGLGKLEVARALAQWVLCETPGSAGPCGVCDACNWFAQGNHPDFRQLEPREEEVDESGKVTKKASKQIDVESVRALGGFFNLSAHRGGWRVAVIHPAETMNTAAANALLKTLEEPPARVLLLLVAHQPGRLLATVRSRCRKVPVPVPDAGVALDWLRQARGAEGDDALDVTALAEAGGAPLRALAYAEPGRRERREAFLDLLARPADMDACAAAQSCQPALEDAWGWLMRWLHDLLGQRMAGDSRYFRARAEIAARIARHADLAGLLALQRELSDAGRWLRHPLNAQLLLESWLIRYVEITRGTR